MGIFVRSAAAAAVIGLLWGAVLPASASTTCATKAAREMTVGMVVDRGVRYAATLEAVAAVVPRGTSVAQQQVGWIFWDDHGGTWFQLAPGAPSALTVWTGPRSLGSLFDPLHARLDTLPSSLRLEACELRRASF